MNELVLTKKEIPELLNKALQALEVSLIILPLPTSYTAHSCLFQPHGRTAGSKRQQQVCPPLGHLCGYSNTKKQFLYLPHDQQSLSLSFFVVSVPSFQNFRNWRNKILENTSVSLPPCWRVRVKTRPPVVQPHSGLLSGGDNTAMRPDGAGSFFILLVDRILRHFLKILIPLQTLWCIHLCITATPWEWFYEEHMKPPALKCHSTQGPDITCTCAPSVSISHTKTSHAAF